MTFDSNTTMVELRKIRDANSRRHLLMTSEELNEEWQNSVAWFMGELDKIKANNQDKDNH